MKLFRVLVTAEVEVIVCAEDEESAREVAEDRDTISQEEMNGNLDYMASLPREVKTLKEVPAHWFGCIPYGAPNDELVEDFLKKDEQ